MIERFLFADDLRPEQTWALLAWCCARGASEFSLDLIGLRDMPEPFCDGFRLTADEFRLPDAAREHMVTYLDQLPARLAELWRLTPASIAVLRAFMDEGLFTYPAGEWETGCIENPTFYRDGEVMLGIVSHEREGVLRLRPGEEAAFHALGIPSRDRPEWI
jgi:hypothetical protein